MTENCFLLMVDIILENTFPFIRFEVLSLKNITVKSRL